MSDIQRTEPVPLPSDVELELLDFEILRENWNRYELEDGTIISTKFVLKQMVESAEIHPDDPELKLGYMEPQNITAVFAPIDKKGPPDRNYSVEELEKYVIDKDCKIINQTITDPTIYKTKRMIIFVYNVIERIEKTSKFNAAGLPMHIIRSSNQILTMKIPTMTDAEKAPVVKNSTK